MNLATLYEDKFSQPIYIFDIVNNSHHNYGDYYSQLLSDALLLPALDRDTMTLKNK